MGTSKRAIASHADAGRAATRSVAQVIAALVACALMATGCFGYNRSAKRWSYVGDTILLLGGGGVIAGDLATKGKDCMETTIMKCEYKPPISGALVVGAVLVAAGLFGYIFNATRDNVKTSR